MVISTIRSIIHRSGESASTGLTESLQRLGYELGRLKTGTPARVDKRTVNFSSLEEQPGEGRSISWHELKL